MSGVADATGTTTSGSGAGRILTVGHSNLGIEDFLAMLTGAGVTDVVDVRRLPGSRRYPWFDQDPLRESLAGAGIGYHHLLALTGRRPRQKDVDPAVNAFWENQSFHNYADYALGPEFAAGLAELRTGCGALPVVMCSEAVWWRCHRRLIADHLLAAGADVRHLMGPGKETPAALTRGAVVGEDGSLTYPAAA